MVLLVVFIRWSEFGSREMRPLEPHSWFLGPFSWLEVSCGYEVICRESRVFYDQC
jgi:hypothetical protein